MQNPVRSDRHHRVSGGLLSGGQHSHPTEPAKVVIECRNKTAAVTSGDHDDRRVHEAQFALALPTKKFERLLKQIGARHEGDLACPEERGSNLGSDVQSSSRPQHCDYLEENVFEEQRFAPLARDKLNHCACRRGMMYVTRVVICDDEAGIENDHASVVSRRRRLDRFGR